MEITNPDFLRPIRDDNRDEYILVEFHRVLVNTNMALLRNLFQASLKDKSLLELLPNLGAFAKLNLDQMYDATVLYNYPNEFVEELSMNRFSSEIADKYVEKFQEPYHFEQLHRSRLSFILHELLDHAFVKNLYIMAPHYTDEMKRYINEIFDGKGVGSRILLVEGNLQDSLSELSQITTVFMSNVSDLIQAESFTPGVINGKMFLIADGYANFEIDERGELQYQYVKLFEEWKREKRCMVDYMYPSCIEKLGKEENT